MTRSYLVMVKEGVKFDIIAPAGFAILAALWKTAQTQQVNLTITSGTDGAHSGPDDPHKKGEAYDVRSKGFTNVQKQEILKTFRLCLSNDEFYCFLENEGSDDEHFHLQRKRGTVYA